MTPEKLEIQSDPDQLFLVDEFTQRIAREMGFSQEQSDDIVISVIEIVNNAITHGNNADPQKKVFISFFKNNNCLKIEIQDQGKGFEPDKIADPTAPANLMKGKGRGIFIVKHLVDEILFRNTPKGMIITLIKRK
jgi:serine/threonine-protein kinase RsbW